MWSVIIALGMNTQSDDVKRNTTSLPLVCTQRCMTWGVACYHCPCVENTIGLLRAVHDIIVLQKHIWVDYVRRGILSRPWTTQRHMMLGRRYRSMPSLLWTTKSEGLRLRGMPSSLLDCTHKWMTLGVACHHRPFVVHTVGLCEACHANIAIRKNTWSDDIERAMTSSPLSSTHRVE